MGDSKSRIEALALLQAQAKEDDLKVRAGVGDACPKKRLCIAVPADIHAKFKVEAARAGKTMSSVISAAINDFIS